MASVASHQVGCRPAPAGLVRGGMQPRFIGRVSDGGLTSAVALNLAQDFAGAAVFEAAT